MLPSKIGSKPLLFFLMGNFIYPLNKNALQPISVKVQMNSNSCRIVNQFYYVILRNERVVGSNPISGSKTLEESCY